MEVVNYVVANGRKDYLKTYVSAGHVSALSFADAQILVA